jgi:hypothetical protein
MAEVIGGPRYVRGPDRDKDRHRTYKVAHIVSAEPGQEGGFAALQATGLPAIGSEFNFAGDYDPYAYCTAEASVSPYEEREGAEDDLFLVEQTFTTRPTNKCSEQNFEDPLLEPMKLSGDFKNRREESSFDRFNRPIVTSSWELIRGKDNEWDVASATVEVEQNVALLELDLCTYMLNRVNMFPLWGLPARCVKLSSFGWSQKFYGQCYYYYTRRFSFDIDFRTHDRYVLDEGTKALRGKWIRAASATEAPVYRVLNNANRWKPADFIRYADPNGNPGRVVLNGYGLPSGVCVSYGVSNPGDEASIPVKYYVATPTRATIVNLGIPVQDRENWVELVSTSPVDFDPFTRYERGTLITIGGDNYVSIADSYAEFPIESRNWRFIPLGGIVSRGEYSASTIYTVGDTVSATAACCDAPTGTGADAVGCYETVTGYILIQKYGDADLLMLGIPLFL